MQAAVYAEFLALQSKSERTKVVVSTNCPARVAQDIELAFVHTHFYLAEQLGRFLTTLQRMGRDDCFGA